MFECTNFHKLLFVPVVESLALHDVRFQIPTPSGMNQLPEQTELMTPDCCSWWEVPQPLTAATGFLLETALHRQKLTQQSYFGLKLYLMMMKVPTQ
jgi:hypothetical protein